MIKKVVISHVILLILLWSQVNAQVCEYLLGADEVPMSNQSYQFNSEKFKFRINSNLASDIESIQSKYKKDYKAAYEFSSGYLIELFDSEYFLFGDTINTIVENIGAQLLKANNINRSKEVHFLVSRTGVPNAFTMNNGTIVVNLGLISRMNHLDELAFVLAHELAHHHLNHIQNAIDNKIELVNSTELKQKLKAAKRGEEYANRELEKLLKESSFDLAKHSRNAELETDALGYEFYINAGFSAEYAYSLLEVLKELDKPKYPLPALDSIFNFENYPWQSYWAESHLSGLSLVELSEDEKEKYRTHPQVSERLTQIKNLGASSVTNIEASICADSPRLDLEILEDYYDNGHKFDAFILALQMSLINPSNFYVQEIISHCLLDFGLARILDFGLARKNHTFSKLVPLPGRKLSKQQNLIATFLDNLRLREIEEISKAYFEKNLLLKYTDVDFTDIKNKINKLEN